MEPLVKLINNYANANMDISGIMMNGDVFPNVTTNMKNLFKTNVFAETK